MNNKETLINHIEDKVPKLRFPEFTDPWEQRKLDTITDVRDGTHDSPQYVEIGHPFITSKNVKDGFINYEDIQYVSDKDYEEINKRSKVDKNDILMGMIGTIGNIALVRETPDFAIKNVALIKDIGDVYYRYLYHCLQSNSIAHQLDENLDGGTQKFIALNKIRELVIPVPSEREQHKIGDYMESLDNLITLHQNKLNILNKYKRGLLFKIFTSFNRDNLISLKELIDKNVIEIKRGNIIPKQYGIYPVYSSSVHNNGLFCYSDNYMFDEELVSWSIDGGGNFFYRPKHKFSLTNVTGYIKVKNKNILNTQYLYYNLDYLSHSYNFDYQNKALPSYISKLYKIYLPPIKVQEKTAKILSTFDELIEKENNILSLLKKYKQGLLQQMFI